MHIFKICPKFFQLKFNSSLIYFSNLAYSYKKNDYDSLVDDKITLEAEFHFIDHVTFDSGSEPHNYTATVDFNSGSSYITNSKNGVVLLRSGEERANLTVSAMFLDDTSVEWKSG